jgi:4-hydroxybenzoate polyprenyltransferase
MTTLEGWIPRLTVAPLFFSRHLPEWGLLGRCLAGLALFCLCSSAVYVFNDLVDRKCDSQHPKKRLRPLAAGRVSPPAAIVLATVLAAGGLSGAALLAPAFFLVLAGYLALNVAYSLRLKQIVILDVMCIAAGFVLRAVAGGVLAGVQVTDWLILCTSTLAIFLGFSKRRQELVLAGKAANGHRPVLALYSIPFLDQLIAVASGFTVISYAMYTVADETVARFNTRGLLLTVPFVLFGVFRYFYLTYHAEVDDNPTNVLIKDTPILVNTLLYIAVVALTIY